MHTLLLLSLFFSYATATPQAHAGIVGAQLFEDRNGGPLSVFPKDEMHCSRGSWIFPGLVWGDRPISVCMVKPKTKNRFGGAF